jgi:hypothetical protein
VYDTATYPLTIILWATVINCHEAKWRKYYWATFFLSIVSVVYLCVVYESMRGSNDISITGPPSFFLSVVSAVYESMVYESVVYESVVFESVVCTRVWCMVCGVCVQCMVYRV